MSRFWFDCHCSYGRTARPPFRFAADPDALLAEMDAAGLDRALTWHGGQQCASPVVWNPRTAEDLRGRPRLRPAWAILPPATGELPPPDRFFEAMKRAGVSALWAFPNEHRFRLDGLGFEGLFHGMVERRIPLFVRQNPVDLKELLADCPELPVVACAQGPHSVERHLRPLLDRFPNLLLETSGLLVEGLIESFCERTGPARLLFGSGFPATPPGAALLRLLHADIGEEARRAVAGGNLERLLGEVRL